MKRPAYLLTVIILAQFAGTSLWFAGNAVLPEWQKAFHLNVHSISSITTAVQLGFISGTFVFALLAIADRLRPSAVFFTSSLLAAIANFSVILIRDESSLLALRFFTGFFLAGIYPVGMKLAADWYEEGLGKALGFLVGALVLGTAFPHLLKGKSGLPWKQIMTFTSLSALIGGIAVLLLVPDGPYRKKATQFAPAIFLQTFKSATFRSAAFGYFGHMWELYTFWAFVPILIQLHNEWSADNLSIPIYSFITIGCGFFGCIAGGWLSVRFKSATIAFGALLASGICCLLSAFVIKSSSPVFILFLLIWGVTVIADSPQFSALVAAAAPAAQKGTALTLVTCIGFAITVISIFLFDDLLHRFHFSRYTFLLLLPGPVLGLLALRPLIFTLAKPEKAMSQ